MSKATLIHKNQSKIRCSCGEVIRYGTLRWGEDPLKVCKCGKSYYKETVWSPPFPSDQVVGDPHKDRMDQIQKTCVHPSETIKGQRYDEDVIYLRTRIKEMERKLESLPCLCETGGNYCPRHSENDKLRELLKAALPHLSPVAGDLLVEIRQALGLEI